MANSFNGPRATNATEKFDREDFKRLIIMNKDNLNLLTKAFPRGQYVFHTGNARVKMINKDKTSLNYKTLCILYAIIEKSTNSLEKMVRL